MKQEPSERDPNQAQLAALESENRSLRKRLQALERSHSSVLRNASVSEEIAERGKRLLMRTQEQLEAEIRERRRTEEALRRAKESAEVGSESKSRFLATMSHEMRTPLNGVIGVLELLQRGPLDSEQEELARIAQNSARSLVRLINQLLDFTRLEAGHIDLEQAPFSLTTMIEDLVSLEAITAHEKGLQLCAVIDPQTPNQVIGDGERIRQVLLNLISNAVKYTEAGEVTVRIRAVADTQPAKIRFEVIDTGPGIADQDMERLFEPFTRADEATSRFYESTGLGLTISRRLVGSLGGELSVDSVVGEGSCFCFALSLEPYQSASPRSARRFLEGHRVGIADPSSTFIDQVRSIVEPLGGEVCAVGGAEAARLLCDKESLLALLTSEDFPELLSAPPEGTRLIPLLLLGNDEPALSEDQLILHKPLRRAALIRALLESMDQAAELRREGNTAAEASTEAELQMKWTARVLMVDDHPANRLVARLLLERLGCTVLEARSGFQALELAQSTELDLIFMDCSMPEMDGYETTRKLRSQSQPSSKLPVVAMTAFALAGDRERCLAAGMNDYISKPIDLAALKEVLRAQLGEPSSTAGTPAKQA